MPDTDELKRQRVERLLYEWESFAESAPWQETAADLRADIEARRETLMSIDPCNENVPGWARVRGENDALKTYLERPAQRIEQLTAILEGMSTKGKGGK